MRAKKPGLVGLRALLGFAGVLVMVRPNPAGIDWLVLWPLAAALLSAVRDTVTRKLATPISDAWQVMAVLVAGSMAGLAHYLTLSAFHLAEGATVAPFRYGTFVATKTCARIRLRLF